MDTVEVKESDKIFGEILPLLDSFKVDAQKYAMKQTKAAALRARKVSSALTRLFKEYRAATIEETR